MEQNKLNTTNPEAITYTTEEISITILGGIKLEGLDRMRVTLKIEVTNRKFKHYLNNPDIADLALRQNLDLYNDTQTEKLIRKTADRIEVGSTAIAKALADITNQLEEYRLKELESLKVEKVTKVQITEAERAEAMNFLKTPDLLLRTNEAIGRSGVIGEENNRLLMYIIFTSRKLNHPLHIISLGSSGTGKTHLQEKVSELIPEEDKIEITTLSENAFYYFERRALSNKLILIEDMEGAMNVLFPLRELQSKKKITKTVTFKDTRGITKTITLTVEGPVSIAGCTTRERIYEDNANRSFLIYLDESSEQDNKIMEYQRLLSAGKIDTTEQEKIKEQLKNTQRVLQPIKVINPYAEYLQLPEAVFKPRRTNKHYIDFIEAITFYHQYQRESKVDTQTGEIYIETTLEDIENANKLMKEILLRKSDELSGACRNYFEELKKYLQQTGQSTFSNKEIRQALRINHNVQKMYMVQLQQYGFIRKTKGNKKQGFIYEVISAEEYHHLQQHINNMLDKILEHLKTINASGGSPQEAKKLGEVVKDKQPLKPLSVQRSKKKLQKL